MAEEESWASKCIEKVKESHTAVNETVANRLRDLLSGQMCERPFRPSELLDTAQALITDMAAASSDKAVSSHEDE